MRKGNHDDQRDLTEQGGRPGRVTDRYPGLPEEIEFFHAEEILERYPDLPRKQRETAMLQEHPAIFIIGIGWTLADGYPHEMRAADSTTG